MLARVSEVIAELKHQSAAAAGRRDRRGDRSSSNGSRPTISPCSACATTPHRRASSARAGSRPGSACCARRELRVLRARRPARHDHAGDPRLPQRAEAAHHHQGQRSVARAPPRLSRLRRRQALRRATASSSANSASSGCSPRPPTRARSARIPVSAAQGRRASIAARRLRSGQPFRQGAGQRAGELSARRAVPDRRGHALSFRARHPAARRAAARARAGAARPLRPLRLGAGLCAARALRQRRCAARIGDYLAGVFKGRVARLLSVLPGRAAGARAFHHRPRRRRRRPIPIAPRSNARSRRSCAPGPTRSRKRSPRRTSRRRRARCSTRYRDAFSDGYREVYPPLDRHRATSASSRR